MLVDEEGNELDVDPAELERERPASRNGRARPAARGGNVRIQPPSWRRIGKRGLIFAPLMFVTVMFIDSTLTIPQVAVQTILLLMIFLPFSYFMDSMVWRSYQRRLQRSGESKKR